MSQIKITYKAFGDKPEIDRFVSSVEFKTGKVEEAGMEKFLESIFFATNTYSGHLWNVIKPLLSPTRTHTSLSVGDEVEVDGQVYLCADFGFKLITEKVGV